MDFKDRLRELRTNKGLSLRELGRIMNVSHVLISQYENGHRRPSFEMIEALAAFFNVTPNYLLGYDLTDSEQTLLQAYREADETSKRIVRYALGLGELK